ncbi:hypothetical protein [Methylomarinum vadi]|uniref:hypothetical protein n=1 Tax=Methylomarinum vadi TaxID=438855 RepID=UPI0004DF0E57|nr:hypothetical protein [Methylomarinum vadi]
MPLYSQKKPKSLFDNLRESELGQYGEAVNNRLGEIGRDVKNSFDEGGLVGAGGDLAFKSIEGLTEIANPIRDFQIRALGKTAGVLFGRKWDDKSKQLIDYLHKAEKDGNPLGYSLVKNKDTLPTPKPGETKPVGINGSIPFSAVSPSAKQTVQKPLQKEVTPSLAMPRGLRINVNQGRASDYLNNDSGAAITNPLLQQTGINAKNIPRGAFGGIAGLNMAIASMLPAVARNNQVKSAIKQRNTENDQALKAMELDNEAASKKANFVLESLKLDDLVNLKNTNNQLKQKELNQPIVKLRKIYEDDGLGNKVVVGEEPIAINPNTGRIAETQAHDEAVLALEKLADSDLSQEDKVGVINKIQQRLKKLGYAPLPLGDDELMRLY